MLRRTIKVAVLAATIMGSVAVASPAVAGADVIVTPPELKPPEGVGYQEKCIVVSNPDGPEQSTVCIIEDGKAHSATVDYLGRQNVSISWRVWMDQCRGDGTNCSTVEDSGWDTVYSGPASYVSWKTDRWPNSYGHVYRACASLHNQYWGYSEACTLYMS